MSETATAVRTEPEASFQIVSLDQLTESKTNPRKYFAKDALSDLTKSIAEKGVLVPLLVRPINWRDSDNRKVRQGEETEETGTYEILAGARRYRAAKAAKVDSVPILIRRLDDEQALEVQVIENLQREDVHPLEEAEGYRQLLAKGKYNVETLADKVGKSVRYIYARVQLLQLTDQVKKALEEEKITAGHAILLARLQPADQLSGLEYCSDRWHPASVRDLNEWINREVHLDLAKAPWKKDDANLLPAAGACTTCPKRTGATPALFPDIKKGDTCTDPTCYRQKLGALVEIKLEQDATAQLVSTTSAYSGNEEKALKKQYPNLLMEREYRKAGNTKCKSTRNGLIVDGDGAGTFIRICPNLKCKTHRDPYASSYSRPRSPKQSAKAIAAEKAAAAKRELDDKVNDAAFIAAVGKVKILKQLPVAMWRLIAKAIIYGYYGSDDLVGQALGVKGSIEKAVEKCKPAEIPAFLFAHAASAENGGLTLKERLEAIKLAGVDVAAIRSKLASEAKAAKKAQTSAKPKAA